MTFVNFLKGYNVIFSESAKKDLKCIEECEVKKIHNKLKMLVEGQPGLDIKKLVGNEKPAYRLRVGDYRVIYEVLEMPIEQKYKVFNGKE